MHLHGTNDSGLEAYKLAYSYLERSGYSLKKDSFFSKEDDVDLTPHFYFKVSPSVKKYFGGIAASFLSSLIQGQNKVGWVTQTQELLARQAQCSTSAIEKAVRALKKAGLLKVKQRKGSDRTNSYWVNYAALNLLHEKEGTILTFKEKVSEAPNNPERGGLPHPVKITGCTYNNNIINRYNKSDSKKEKTKTENLHVLEIKKRLNEKLGIKIQLDREKARQLGGIRKKFLQEKLGLETAEAQAQAFEEGIDQMIRQVGGIPTLAYALDLNSWDKAFGINKMSFIKKYKPPERADKRAVEAEMLERINNSDVSPDTKQAQKIVLQRVSALAYKSWLLNQRWEQGKIIFKNKFCKDAVYQRYAKELEGYTDWEIGDE